MQERDKVNMYGGLGKVGLDYANSESSDEDDPEKKARKEAIPAFSSSVQLKSKKSEGGSDAEEEEDEMLVQDFDDMLDELKQIDDEIEDIEVDINDIDKAAYEIPATDDGYKKILKERFSHDEFLEGQLDAIKVVTEAKSNALVVLATGGGKSLIY
jgi:hypothetical protein